MKQTLIIILLTTIFSITAKSQTTQKAEDCAECIYPDELPNHLNSNVKVVCKVIKVLQKPNSNGQPTFINFEHTDFNVIIYDTDLKNFLSLRNLKLLEGKNVIINGFVKIYNPAIYFHNAIPFPQIVINDISQITIN